MKRYLMQPPATPDAGSAASSSGGAQPAQAPGATAPAAAQPAAKKARGGGGGVSAAAGATAAAGAAGASAAAPAVAPTALVAGGWTDLGAGARVGYFPRHLAAMGHRMMAALQANLAWEQREVKIFGQLRAQPRLVYYMADPEHRSYTYSGLTLQAAPWSAEVLEVKAALEALTGVTFNTCLLNLYRTGNDSLGWHSDEETPRYGPEPSIGSVSFGETRDFVMRRTRDHAVQIKTALASGDVLVMAGTTQRHWQHYVPVRKRAHGARINLTFRRELVPGGAENDLAQQRPARSSPAAASARALQPARQSEGLSRTQLAMAEDFELVVRDGAIYWGSERVSIKGVNFFGLETADFALHGLWCANLMTLLDFVAAHFNAVRLPFSAELALNMDARRPGNIDYAANPELKGLTTGQVMDRFVQECAARGLLVLLDLHRLAAAADIPELWYSAEYPEQAVLQAWRTVVLRYKPCWNVFAADLNNEPHGCASWGDGVVATDWRLAAERIAAVVLEANPRLLIFVEGVERNAIVQPGEACWWGGHFAAAEKAPVRLPAQNKLVYSPHVYGPDVFAQARAPPARTGAGAAAPRAAAPPRLALPARSAPRRAQAYFSDPAFPANMPDIWRRHFGWGTRRAPGPPPCLCAPAPRRAGPITPPLSPPPPRAAASFVKQDGLGPAIVAGEWGGWARAGSADETWQFALASWFVENGVDSSFYWCLNPNVRHAARRRVTAPPRPPHARPTQRPTRRHCPRRAVGRHRGVLLEDWSTPNEGKLAILAKAHPNPTRWPQAPVTPQAPPPEECHVPAGVDPAACAPAAAPAPAQGGGQAPAAAPAAATGPPQPLACGDVQVSEVNSWDEGGVACHQLEVTVTNPGPTPASSMCLRVGCAGELVKSWNCTPLPDADGCWCFDMPDWVAPGGLAAGASVVVGLIVKGDKPTAFTLAP
ncbi:Endoglucanase [Scenedesmus sp. PABB004]|nr:Endoglucanase [Scenedesmus sp. PABB004]